MLLHRFVRYCPALTVPWPVLWLSDLVVHAVLKRVNDAIAAVPEEERTSMFDAVIARQPA